MGPTLCSRCGDAVEEGCDPRDELAELDVLLERIKLKRYDLKRKINQHHSPIVRQLPPDVTSTIFEFCLPDFADRQILQKDLSFPLSLGATCSYWRDIAWSTPSLWSSLVVRDTRRKHTNLSTITGVAQEWLARSGQLPLYICIALTNKIVSTRLLDVINRYSTRWSDLDLSIPLDCYRHFHAIDNHAPTLKSIRFQVRSLADAMRLKFQLTCPRLERATLENFPMDRSNIQWDNLTHLTLHSMSIIDSFLILRKTPRLVFCKVLNTSLPHRLRNIGAIALTSLRFLHLPINFAEDFLNNIISPHLEELSLPYYFNPSMEVVTSFFRRSACSLRSLYMAFRSFTRHFDLFMNLFQSMNTLSILSITEPASYFENTTMEDYDLRNILQLAAKVLSSQSTSPQQGFLPNLKILEYTGKLRLRAGNLNDRYSLPPTDNSVHGPLHLFKLDLHPVTRIPENMISYFSSLEERGVTVNVLSNSEDILQSSIAFYRRREEILCRDWADNLDSSLFS